jgi:hypothetical protein
LLRKRIFDSDGVEMFLSSRLTQQEQDNLSTLEDRVPATVTALSAVANGTGNMTTAQLTTAARTIAKALVIILRSQYDVLDGTD